MTTGRIVLASASPRRRELLEQLALVVEVVPADVDETPRPGEAADAYVTRLARSKADTVAATLTGDGWAVIGADTAVVVDGDIVGKPAGDDDARVILTRLSGRSHGVVTGVSVVTPAAATTGSTWTEVTIAAMSSNAIDWYVATGEPADKAGAYGIQGIGGVFVASIDGSYSNVVGLPLGLTAELLASVGVTLPWS